MHERYQIAIRGVTLIELLLVIFIVSTIGLLAVSFSSRLLIQNALDNAENQLVGALRKAQIYSMMGRKNGVWGVKYTTSPKKITLYLVGNTALDENYDVNSNITITGFSDISFAKITGLPSTTATITISDGNNIKIININNQGVVSKTD